MTAPVVSVAADTPVGKIAQVLRQHGISGVPVTDSAGSVIGMVSGYDLLARSGSAARDVMTAAVVSVTEGTGVEEVRHLLVNRQIRRIPVLAGGRLVGIISRGDLVSLMATEWACAVCGETVRGGRRPDRCPKCLGGAERFVLQDQAPGS